MVVQSKDVAGILPHEAIPSVCAEVEIPFHALHTSLPTQLRPVCSKQHFVFAIRLHEVNQLGRVVARQVRRGVDVDVWEFPG